MLRRCVAWTLSSWNPQFSFIPPSTESLLTVYEAEFLEIQS